MYLSPTKLGDKAIVSSFLLIEPLVSSVDIVRVNQTAFQLTVNVDYTGGGDITHFTVSFRKSGSTDDFNHLGDIPASPQSMLVWNGVITNAEFASLEVLEFDVTVNNERSFSSTTSSPVQEATGRFLIPDVFST